MNLIRKPQLLELLGVSAATVDRMVRSGAFPAPIRIGRRAIAWRESDIAAWIENRSLAGADPEEAA
jgi:prophage regulatory protein